ncbi:TetR/AcrR family transcriptional regulator [Paraburkholderia sp. LEh10]|jgi:AcrR family transcriptional regulator|uniref:TetR/AcrR family transcriptional regulator n=1 Tax=Paraburkholderia sp. LEh10 TaxID=2821353 RepID=UPI001AE83DA5|nr:TetR/AcrR family transcriptional regulator [Paraburkholderia sp. LEh10]MBP0590838.1 TetR/AcrR family transcriptional regulator [Paraburkholderia sp. LEh10]
MSSEASRATSSAYHHGDLRNALIAQGRYELETFGPNELSLRRLAKAVGVSSAASVRHFSDKAEFLAALAADGFRELAGIRRGIISAGGDSLTVAYRMLNAYVEFADAHKGVFALMVGPRIIDRDAYPELLRVANDSFSDFAGAIAAYAMECGWTAESMPFVSHGAWAMEHGLATLILSSRVPRTDVRVDVGPMVHFSITMYLHAIAAGPERLQTLLEATARA